MLSLIDVQEALGASGQRVELKGAAVEGLEDGKGDTGHKEKADPKGRSQSMKDSGHRPIVIMRAWEYSAMCGGGDAGGHTLAGNNRVAAKRIPFRFQLRHA